MIQFILILNSQLQCKGIVFFISSKLYEEKFHSEASLLIYIKDNSD